MSHRQVVVLGGSGFVGRASVAALVQSGHDVLAPVRSREGQRVAEDLGARAVLGDVTRPHEWIGHVTGADAVIDLTQPPLPRRLSARAARGVARHRVATTTALLAALAELDAGDRPLWVSVSGTDDLAPDAGGRVSGASPVREQARGFARIGLPVREVVARSGYETAFVHFGQMVYGPGKGYAHAVVAPLRAGKARIIGRGDNRLPLTHLDDAAAALAHVVGLDRGQVAGRTVVAVPLQASTQAELYRLTADALGVAAPGRVPAAVAGLVAGVAMVEAMTLDARCEPDLLTATGFRFRHPTLASGIAASLNALGLQ